MTAVAHSRNEQHAWLLTEVRRAIAAGDLVGGLGFAYRAYRLSPTLLETSLLVARLLISLGRYGEAIGHLQAEPSNTLRAEQEAALTDALRLAGRYEAAKDQLQKALNRHSVSAGSDVALAAHRLISDPKSNQPGWIGQQTDLRLYGELRTDYEVGFKLTVGEEEQPLQAFRAAGDGVLELLTRERVLRRGRLAAFAGSKPIIGNGLVTPPDYRLTGRCLIADEALQGWVQSAWAPNLRPTLDLTSSSGARLVTDANEPETVSGVFNFHFDLEVIGFPDDEVGVAVLLPDGDILPLADAPARARPPPPPKPFPSSGQMWTKPAPIVDVIIPCFSGRAETLTCLRSVLSTTRGIAEIIVIDDASPDVDLKIDLDQMFERGRIRLIRNGVNRGFPHAVNQGLAVNPDRDVVILNADAEVYAGWLGRLQKAAYSNSQVGTVTPLSNSGSIVSYPDGETNRCSSVLGRERDEWASAVNAGQTAEIPTGVGFCLYIKRECLKTTGPFDAATFLRGYGEENDFCMRAAARGWRHVAAADVYVRHIGSISFGEGRFALQARNGRLLSQRHPTYDEQVARHHRSDPLAIARRRLAEAELKVRAEGGVALLISLGIGGGVDHFIEKHNKTLTDHGLTALVLQSLPDAKIQLKVLGADALPDLLYGWRELNDALALFDALRIERLELHHFLGHSDQWIDRVLMGRDYVAYLHDFSWYCPRLSLLGGQGEYCGEPDAAGCQACIDQYGSSIEGEDDVADLRTRSRRWLGQAKRVVAASADTADRYRRQFPGLSISIEPWEVDPPFVPKAPPYKSRSPVRVAVVGAIGEQKGSAVLLACAKDAADRALPLEFSLIGFSDIDEDLTATGRVFISGRYQDADLQSIIAIEQPHLAFLPSVTPETWSYTLSHVFRAGIPPVAFDLGVISKRIRAAGLGELLLAPGSPASAINDRLISLVIKQCLNTTNLDVTDEFLSGNNRPALIRPSVPEHFSNRRTRGEPTSETNMQADPPTVRASAQILPLNRGVYLFSVEAATARPVIEGDVTLPALSLSPAPGSDPKAFEFLGGLRTEGAWLREARDIQVVKVNSGDALLLVTSYTTPDSAPLSMQVERIDGRQRSRERASSAPSQPMAPQLSAPPVQAPAASAPMPGTIATEPVRGFRTQITAHIANRGDVNFVGAPWAGTLSERFPIEAFTIAPLEGIASNHLEYKAMLANGTDTGWIEGGQMCGTQRQRMAITGFAVRLKADRAKAFTVEYSGRFTSGRLVGPTRDGQPCASDTAGDALYAMQVVITEQDTTTAFAQPSYAESMASNVAAQNGAPAPRFSVFRQ